MSEKILNEFAVRLNKSRTQLTDVCNQVDSLRKEAGTLQNQLNDMNREKEKAEAGQRDLKKKYIASMVAKEKEVERYDQEQAQLKDLRKRKADL